MTIVTTKGNKPVLSVMENDWLLVVGDGCFKQVFRKVLSKELSLYQICGIRRSQLCKDHLKKKLSAQRQQFVGEKSFMLCKRNRMTATGDREWWARKEWYEIRLEMWARSRSLLWLHDHSIMKAFQLYVAEIHLPNRSLRLKVRKPVF